MRPEVFPLLVRKYFRSGGAAPISDLFTLCNYCTYVHSKSWTFISRSNGNIDVVANQELEAEKREKLMKPRTWVYWAEGKGASSVAIDDQKICLL